MAFISFTTCISYTCQKTIAELSDSKIKFEKIPSFMQQGKLFALNMLSASNRVMGECSVLKPVFCSVV